MGIINFATSPTRVDNPFWQNVAANVNNPSYGWGASPSQVGSSPTSKTGTGTTAEEPKPLTEAGGFFDDAPDWTYYQPMQQETMDQRAQEYGQVYAQPLYQELERRLEQAISDAAAQEARIHGAYAGTEAAFGRRENEQARRDMESAIARGAGRSGVVGHLSGQRQEHFSELLAAEEAKRNAELYAIANQLGLAQRQVPQHRMDITEQAGRLANQELQRLAELEYGRRREHDLDQWERMLSVFDRTRLTPVEQLAAYIQMAEAMGETPKSVPTVYGTF